jgi:sulfite exporter TauE/SafE
MTFSAGVFAALFLTGLLGGVHCMGMCGGIVAALSGGGTGKSARWDLHLGYNLGRIASYAVAGALAGALGSAGLLLDGVLPVQLVLYVAANIVLIGLGLYLAGISRVVASVERAGLVLWRRIQPLTRAVLPAETLPKALALGLLWGWIPCGLVYGILVTALLSGDPMTGAAVMAAFGAGTLPNLLVAGLAWRKLRGFRQARPVRLASGALVLGFGVYGLAHAATLSEHIRDGVLCLG